MALRFSKWLLAGIITVSGGLFAQERIVDGVYLERSEVFPQWVVPSFREVLGIEDASGNLYRGRAIIVGYQCYYSFQDYVGNIQTVELGRIDEGEIPDEDPASASVYLRFLEGTKLVINESTTNFRVAGILPTGSAHPVSLRNKDRIAKVQRALRELESWSGQFLLDPESKTFERVSPLELDYFGFTSLDVSGLKIYGAYSYVRFNLGMTGKHLDFRVDVAEDGHIWLVAHRWSWLRAHELKIYLPFLGTNELQLSAFKNFPFSKVQAVQTGRFCRLAVRAAGPS